MITKFQIFERKKSIWSFINNNYEDDALDIHIDAWTSEDDEEEGKTIALIDILSGEVSYEDIRAMDDKYAQEVIEDTLLNIVPKRREELEEEKFNL